VTGALIIALPVLPGGLGGVEATLPLVFAGGGVAFAEAALVVLAWRVLSFWVPAVAGIAALATLERRGRSVG
jgi:uncharacterized protein (TIRG00374 family)